MKISIVSILALCAFTIILSFTGCAPSAMVTASVNFGNPPEGGGACTGKGLCSVKPVSASSSTDGAINVTFQVSPSDKNILNMSFIMADLNQKQPQQVQFINPSMPTYIFDRPYDLTDPVFAPLKLQANPKILPSTPGKVTIEGDKVTIAFQYAHTP